MDYVLSRYLEAALAEADYDKLEDGTFAGRIPPCPGIVAFAETLETCRQALRSTLEDWLLLGLKLGHPLPVLAGIDLNEAPRWTPCKRAAFVRRLRGLGFDGPFAGRSISSWCTARIASPSPRTPSIRSRSSA